jgi:hypothetical protein
MAGRLRPTTLTASDPKEPLMFTSISFRTAQPRSARRRRAVVGAAIAAGMLAAIVSAASPAVAGPGAVPFDRDRVVVAVPSATTTEALRSALEALPDRALVHVGQIVKNFAQGVLD